MPEGKGLGEEQLTAEQKAIFAQNAIYNSRDILAVKEFIAQNDPKGFEAYRKSVTDETGQSRPLHLEGMEVQGFNIGASANSPTKKMGEAHTLDGKWDFSGAEMAGAKFHDLSFDGELRLPKSFTTAEIGVGETKDFKRFEAVLENVSARSGRIENLEGVIIAGKGGLTIGGGKEEFDLSNANLQNLKFKDGADIHLAGPVNTTGMHVGGEAMYKGKEVLDYNPHEKEAAAARAAAQGGTEEFNRAREQEVTIREQNAKFVQANTTQLAKLEDRAHDLMVEYGKDNHIDVTPLAKIKTPNGISPEQLAAIVNVLPQEDISAALAAGHFLDRYGPKPEEKKDLDHGHPQEKAGNMFGIPQSADNVSCSGMDGVAHKRPTGKTPGGW